MSTQPLFEVRGLEKSYGPNQVLAGLDFDVLDGECLVILGASGSGKSVSLRLLNGLETPDAGSVRFDGVELVELSEHELFPYRRRIGMLFQGGALFDSMTVFDNIAFPLREHLDLSADEIRDEVERQLERVSLSGIGDKVPADLSGGMKKRVALARSLALEPEAILFDEPTTGLDPVTSSTIARLVLRVRDNLGITSVVVTHDLPLARTVGSRVAFLSEGHFRFLGTWEEADASDDPVLSGFLEGREPEGWGEGPATGALAADDGSSDGSSHDVAEAAP